MWNNNYRKCMEMLLKLLTLLIHGASSCSSLNYSFMDQCAFPQKDHWEMVLYRDYSGLIGNWVFVKKWWWDWEILSDTCPKDHFLPWKGYKGDPHTRDSWKGNEPFIVNWTCASNTNAKHFAGGLVFSPWPRLETNCTLYLSLAKFSSNYSLGWLHERARREKSARKDRFHTHVLELVSRKFPSTRGLSVSQNIAPEREDTFSLDAYSSKGG
jgi:hypothetical protein